MNQPATQLSSSTPAPYVVGVDVGGTKIAAGVVDAHGSVLSRTQQPTDRSHTDQIIAGIGASVAEAIERAGVARDLIGAVGLGIPGQVDPQRGIAIFATNLGWRNVPLVQRLQAMLALPCAIENDVRAATLGEQRFGAARGLDHVVYLSVGTGIAAGVIMNGALQRGAHGMAGELGHVMIQRDGPRCSCGGHGCVESIAAGPAIGARATVLLEAGATSVLNTPFRQAGGVSSHAVFTAAAGGDPLAQQVVRECSAAIAHAIYLAWMAYDPELVVLGGGIAANGALLLDPVQNVLQQWAADAPVFGALYQPHAVQLSTLEQDAGVLGAAALVSAAR